MLLFMRLRKSAVIAVVCALVAGVPGDRASTSAPAGGPVEDLLNGRDWAHFAGGKPTDAGVRVTPLDRRITRQDGTGGQPNPPVNLRGPHMVFRGDVRIEAGLRRTDDTDAYLHLYGETPVIYDEWRYERRGVRIGVAGGRLRIDRWDGDSDRPAMTRTFGSGLGLEVRLAVEVHANRLVLEADGRVVGTVPARDVFSGGRIWFGADAGARGKGWTLSDLHARSLGRGRMSVVDAPGLRVPRSSDAIRDLAAALPRPIRMGTALAAGPLLTDSAYRRTAGEEFSMLTPENDFKPQFVQPRRGVFAFAEGDVLVDFAEANRMKVHAHTLVWFEALPAWMRAEMTHEQRRRVMVEHIRAVASHFRGKVAEWDVVNEPMSDEDEDYSNGNRGVRPQLWFEAMGEQYIDIAFHAAREADPHAVLYLNEYGVEEDGPRWDALYALLIRLKARGVPIDGVGFQDHEYAVGDRTDPEVFRRKVRALAELGLKARVSEADVLVDDEEEDIQADQLAGKLAVCGEEPNCTSFSTWGFTDKYGSTADLRHYPPSPGNALPWDATYEAKPAYWALRDVLDDARRSGTG
ncbi:endo-1,4-beta-xylanase [Streptomyces sp. BH-SS-21]|uniref:Beta-xylanase n=2 Tax=Streptomyces liliiviolaceus TaxID=2823109 RepID=A0A940XYF2_9ACTN|nr:endo-1,4-beta-xylanase [Streptomyces liliiviolaceus]